MQKLSVNKTLFFLLTVNIGYITGVGLSPLIQPAYYLIFLFFLLYFTKTAINLRNSYFITSLVMGIFVSALIFFQYFALNVDVVRGLIRFALPFFTFATSILLYEVLEKKDKEVFFRNLLKFMFYLLCLDLVWRLSLNLNGLSGGLSSRYVVKSGGLIFYDSNFNGFFAGLFYIAAKGKAPKFVSRGFIFLALCSASLATYGGLIIYAIFMQSAKFLGTTLNSLIFLACVFIVTFSTIHLTGYDGSLDTKLDMVIDFSEFFNSIGSSQLLGIGFGNYQEVMVSRHSAHNLLSQFIEGGLLYMLAIVIFYFYLFKGRPGALSVFPYIFSVGMFSFYPVIYSSLIFFFLYVSFQHRRAYHDVLS